MIIKIKKLLLNNIPIKMVSSVIAFALWKSMGAIVPTTYTLTLPLCFYNVPSDSTLIGPESVTITVQGNRQYVHTLPKHLDAIHIDATQFTHDKKYAVLLDERKLFLSEEVKLIHCEPSPLMITRIKTFLSE